MDVVYLDFQKAFDKMPHKRLLLKLKAHGIGHDVIISDGFQMAQDLNEYFSSVFTTETKFEGNKSEHLGQLFVTPERAQ